MKPDQRRKIDHVRRYTNQDPAYENIRCVYIATPGAMGDEACASVAAIGVDGAEWRDYDMWTAEGEKKFGEVFPPFAQYGYDLTYGSTVTDWYPIYLSHGHSLLVHRSIYLPLKRYQNICASPKGKALKRRFRWADMVDYLLSREKK